MQDESCVLFDSNGEQWSPSGLAAHFVTRLKRRELGGFVLRNLGYVAAEQSFGAFTKVTYLADAVSPVALTALVMWLYDKPERSVMIYDSLSQRSGRLYRSRTSAAEAISATIQHIGRPKKFTCAEADVEKSVFGSRWRAAAALVSTHGLEAGAMARILDALFDGYFTIATRKSPNEDFHLLEVGSALVDHFEPSVSGRSYRDMHDGEYGNWVADGVRRSILQQRPIAQDITAPIKWPQNSRPLVCEYTRLMMIDRRSDRELLVTASHIHSDGFRQRGQMAG